MIFNFKFRLYVIIVGFLVASCSKSDNNPDNEIKDTPNILLIIADDLGKDAINGYTEGTIKPKTPNIDAIRNNGLKFDNFWVNPICTPTRAAIITGKYGYHTGVKGIGNELNLNETVIQKYIKDNTNNSYATAVIGKWHLSGNNSNFNPETLGIDYYSGLIRGAVDDYYKWQLTEDGISKLQNSYITEAFTDLAIKWVNDQNKNWFLWLAYNAPHTPFHIPPGEMHSQGNLPAYVQGMDPTPYYMASIEAMDFQIGRLLENIPVAERENTIILFIGDNGTPNNAAQSPYSSDKVKGTLYQGGINVPMFISGKGVSKRGTDNQLISATDIFATVAELAGIKLSHYNDSNSFKSLLSQTEKIREYQYSEMHDSGKDSWTISNGTYKLIKSSLGDEEMYQLSDDPYELNNLLKSTLSDVRLNAKLALEKELDNIRR